MLGRKRAVAACLAIGVVLGTGVASAQEDAAAEALFGNGDLSVLDEATLRSAVAELPSATAASGATIAQLLVDAGLTSSVSESRRAIEQGGVYLNNARVEGADATIDGGFLPGGLAVLRRGKKTLAGVVAG